MRSGKTDGKDTNEIFHNIDDKIAHLGDVLLKKHSNSTSVHDIETGIV